MEKANFWARFRALQGDEAALVQWLVEEYKAGYERAYNAEYPIEESGYASPSTTYNIVPFREPSFTLMEVPLDILARLVQIEEKFEQAVRPHYHNDGWRAYACIVGVAAHRAARTVYPPSQRWWLESDRLMELRYLLAAGVDVARGCAIIGHNSDGTLRYRETLMEMAMERSDLFLTTLESLARDCSVDFSRSCEYEGNGNHPTRCMLGKLFYSPVYFNRNRPDWVFALLRLIMGDGTCDHDAHMVGSRAFPDNQQNAFYLFYEKGKYPVSYRPMGERWSMRKPLQTLLNNTSWCNPFEVAATAARSPVARMMDELGEALNGIHATGDCVLEGLYEALELLLEAPKHQAKWKETVAHIKPIIARSGRPTCSCPNRVITLAELAVRARIVSSSAHPISEKLLHTLLSAMSVEEINRSWLRACNVHDPVGHAYGKRRKDERESFFTVLLHFRGDCIHGDNILNERILERNHDTMRVVLEHGYRLSEREYRRVVKIFTEREGPRASDNLIDQHSLITLLDKWRFGQLRVRVSWAVVRLLLLAHYKGERNNPFRRVPRDVICLIVREHLCYSGREGASEWSKPLVVQRKRKTE